MAGKKEAKEKPLDKMTVKELRDIAKEIPDIAGVHGMNKGDLLSAIKKFRGIEEPKKKSSGSVREIKSKIRSLKLKKKAAVTEKDDKNAAIYRRRISRLKKKSRRAA